MFGTLVIALPSLHVGGDLELVHNGERKSFATAATSEFRTSVAAWYSDVTHEVKPIESVYRLAITCNLVRTSDEVPESADDMKDGKRKLRAVLSEWTKRGGPSFLVHLLDHEYTEASLSLDCLKGKDAASARQLYSVAQEFDFRVYLALLSREVEGACEDEDDIRMHSLWDEYRDDISLEHVVDLIGSSVVKDVPIEARDIVQREPWRGRSPDGEECSGYTGNEGTTD